MNSACYRFSLSMQSYQSQVSLPVLLGDTARVLLIKFVDNGKPYFINDGCRAVFFAEKPDGNVLINDCIIENNARIRYEFTAQTATASGISKCEIRLYGANGRLITSPKFIMVIDEKVVYDDEVLASYSEFTTLDGIIATEITRAEAEEERVRAENNRSMEFDTTMQNIAAEALASIPTLSVDKKGNTATVTVETKEGETNSVNITDGTPCTHEWNGTKLTVTSASGTSSADLKGDPGDSGISNIGTEFYVSSSDTSPSDGEWINEIPNEVNGKYLWIRIVTVYDNGSVSYSDPVRDPICERITVHENNTNNPHGVTISQIGAAPSGYGLGETAMYFNGPLIGSLERLDNTFATGFYAFNAGQVTLNNVTILGATITVESYIDSRVQQTLKPFGSNLVLRRCSMNGVWDEWECENPPMTVGVEYRTTERWEGKAVYVKLVDCGTLANNANKNVTCIIPSWTIVDFEMTITNGTLVAKVPHFNPSGDMTVRAVCNVPSSVIQILTLDDMSAYTATVKIKYTKD